MTVPVLGMLLLLFAPASAQQRFMGGLPTDSSTVDDFVFAGNSEQVAYVSSDVSSMIHFTKDPAVAADSIGLFLPDGIAVLGANRNWRVTSWNYQPSIDDTVFTNNYLIEPTVDNGRTLTPSKYVVFWKADPNHPSFSAIDEGSRLRGFYQSRNAGSALSNFKPLDIEYVTVPQVTETFRNLPIYLSLPSDQVADWDDPAVLEHIGLNTVELWGYVFDVGHSVGWDRKPYETSRYGNSETLQTLRESLPVKTTLWGGDRWWKVASDSTNVDDLAETRDGSIDVFGRTFLKLTYNTDHDGSTDSLFDSFLEQGKFLAAQGFDTHGFDPEIYVGQNSAATPATLENERGFGHLLDYNPDTIDTFQVWYGGLTTAEMEVYKQEVQLQYGSIAISTTYKDPRSFSDSDQFLQHAWQAFKAIRYTQFFSDYREAVESYLGDEIEMRLTSTYHRFWSAFGSQEYIDMPWTSPVYTNTFEDPRLLADVFDIFHPMVYPDIYANGGDYDMRLPYEDVYGLRNVIDGKVNVAPLLTAGYAFLPGFDADLNAEMLKYNILESFIAGGRGFGIWGETRIDAKDMKVIAETVEALAPYESLIEGANPFRSVSATSGDPVFASQLDGGSKGSLVLVSEYSRATKTALITVAGTDDSSPSPSCVQDVFAGIVESTTAAGSIQWQVELSSRERARIFFVGECDGNVQPPPPPTGIGGFFGFLLGILCCVT